MSDKVDIKSMNLEELTDFMAELGEKPFRAKQIYQWIHRKQIENWDEMQDILHELI